MKPTEQERCEHSLPSPCPRGIASLAHKHYLIESCICSYFTFHSIKNPGKLPSWINLAGSSNLFYLFKPAFTLRIPVHPILQQGWVFLLCTETSLQCSSLVKVQHYPWASHMTAQLHGNTCSPWHSKQHQDDVGNINYKHACQAWSSHALNKKSRRALRWDFSRCQRMGRGSSVADSTSLLLFYCNNYLSCKAFVDALYEPSIFHPLKELLYV